MKLFWQFACMSYSLMIMISVVYFNEFLRNRDKEEKSDVWWMRSLGGATAAEGLWEADSIVEQNVQTKYRSLNGSKDSNAQAKAQTRQHFCESDIWNEWIKMTEGDHVTSNDERTLNRLLKAMVSSRIVLVNKGHMGSHLKCHVFLEGTKMQATAFKPKWYTRDHIINGINHRRHDRHNAEVAAYHIDRILGFNRAPPTVGRYVDLAQEVLPVAEDVLKETFVYDDDDNLCFYGVCTRCRSYKPVCANGTLLEGSLTLWYPHQLSMVRNPWQNSYTYHDKSNGKYWKQDTTFCNKSLKNPVLTELLPDVIDTSIFDFIIGNGDRHTFEYVTNTSRLPQIVHIDNGNGFGDPFEDYESVLAPIYQCCRVRNSTYQRLMSIQSSTASLSHRFVLSTSADPIYPVLNRFHLFALDRRLLLVIKMIHTCEVKYGREYVYLK